MGRAIAFQLAAVAALSGCATGTYQPPPPIEKSSARNEAIVSKTFDTTWSELIDYASSNFFSIENFEKASGLITLSFGSGDPEKFIDCGRMVAEMPGRKIDEPYATYLASRVGAKLTGKMNLVVRSIDAKSTQVKANARYIFHSPGTPPAGSNTWSFDSGGEATIAVTNAMNGTQPTRTCRPTYAAEKAILDAIGK